MEKVSAEPTKEFFIYMLTRDITVSDAIGDLVDNAVDAARNEIYERSKTPAFDLFALKYENTKVEIHLNKNKFVIKDNAGGIPFAKAKEYAFRFGRTESFDGNLGSIGQFGIGMKRAFFKIGKKIIVESSTPNSYFKIEIDVEKWKNDKSENWDFDVTELEAKSNDTIGYGTKITITELYPENQEDFENTIYINGLVKELSIENWYNLSKGMLISINDTPLKAKDLSLYEDELIGLRIGRWQHYYQEEDVDVRIICGLGERKKEDGGWYIFCNDRLILANEQTSITGWGGDGRKVRGGPEYHGQYQRFRGFVFFESKKPSNFPWNTAKTSVNPEHPLYVKVKSQMMDMMKDVNSFLNKLKSEKEGQGRKRDDANSPTEIKIDQSTKLSINLVATKHLTHTKFQAPETVRPKRPEPIDDKQIVTYQVDIDKYERVKDKLGVQNPEDVGIQTFNYYYDNEII